MYEHDGLIYGSLINYTKLNEEGWFNEETEEIEDVNINPNLNPNSKEWEYFFLPQAHRLAIFEDANTSSSQIAYFFEDRKSTRLNSSHSAKSRMPSSA